MKRSTELKKLTQECLHAEKMAQKWTDKAERRRAKVTELENLEMIDFLRKNQIGMDDLPKLLEQLPSLGGVADKEEVKIRKQEEISHEQASNHTNELTDSESK